MTQATFEETEPHMMSGDALDFLRERRSMTKALPDPVPRELIVRVIQAATWAPNHRKTEPWRFVVLVGDSRSRLGDVMAASLAGRLRTAGITRETDRLEKERLKALRAPALIAVAALPSTDPKVIEIEEVAAVAAGVENMLLAAQALGLRAMWRTGAAAYDPAVKEFLGLPEMAHLVAFVYLGFPEIVPPHPPAGDADAKTVWL